MCTVQKVLTCLDHQDVIVNGASILKEHFIKLEFVLCDSANVWSTQYAGIMWSLPPTSKNDHIITIPHHPVQHPLCTKCCTENQRSDVYGIIRISLYRYINTHFSHACAVRTPTETCRTQAQTNTHRHACTRTHARACAHTHTNTHSHTNTHTPHYITMKYLHIISNGWQCRLRHSGSDVIQHLQWVVSIIIWTVISWRSRRKPHLRVHTHSGTQYNMYIMNEYSNITRANNILNTYEWKQKDKRIFSMSLCKVLDYLH